MRKSRKTAQKRRHNSNNNSSSSSSSSRRVRSQPAAATTTVATSILLAVVAAAVAVGLWLNTNYNSGNNSVREDSSSAAQALLLQQQQQQAKERNGRLPVAGSLEAHAQPCTYPSSRSAGFRSVVLQNESVRVVFSNPHAEPLKVLWVDYDGAEQQVGVVKAQADASFESFAGNAWRIVRQKRSEKRSEVVDEIRIDALLSNQHLRSQSSDGAARMNTIHYTIHLCPDEHSSPTEPPTAASVDFQNRDMYYGRPRTGRLSDAAHHNLVREFVNAGCGAGPDAVAEWVSRFFVPGYHALCLKPQPKAPSRDLTQAQDSSSGEVDTAFGAGEGRDGESSERVAVIGLNGGTSLSERYIFDPRPGTDSQTAFRRLVESMFGFSRTDANVAAAVKRNRHQAPQPWSMFGTDGTVLNSHTQVLAGGGDGMVLVFEGGQFIWPGIDVGFTRRVAVVDKVLELETLSMRPLVLSVQNFLEDGECDRIIETAKPYVRASEVKLMDKDKGKAATEFRTSSTHFLGSLQHPFLKPIDERVANLTRIPLQFQEDVQVLRYNHGQYYLAHHDYFDPAAYRNGEMFNHINAGHLNRLLTVFWYMTDVDGGGYTAFPRADLSYYGTHPVIAAQPEDSSCTAKLKVPPRRGKVIIFYSLLPNGDGDVTSQHAACPVTDGTKWAANKWVWNGRPYFK